MTRIRLLALGFALCSLALLFWLFVNWYVWSVADLDCVDGYWACRRTMIAPMALKVGLPMVAWLLFGAMLVREGKKGR